MVLDPDAFSGAVITGLAFSASGRRLAVAGDVVQIWDIHGTQQRLVHTLRGQREFGGVGACTDVAYSPDGLYLLVSVNGYNASLRVYETSDYSEIKEVYGGHDGYIVQIAFSRDGKYLVTAGADNCIHVWDWPKRVKVKSYRVPKPIVHLGFPCGCSNVLALTDDGDAYYWSLLDGAMPNDDHRKRLHSLYTNCPPVRRGTAHPHAALIDISKNLSLIGGFEPDRQSDRYMCRLWPAGAQRPKAEHVHGYFVTACAYEPETGLAASADSFGQVHLWFTDSGLEVARLESRSYGIYSVAFESQSRVAFGTRPYREDTGWDLNHYGPLDRVIDLDQWQVTSRPATPPVPVTSSGNQTVKLGSGLMLSVQQPGRVPSIPFGRSSFYRPLSFASLMGDELGFPNPVVVGFSNGVVCAYDPTNLLTQRTFFGHLDRVWGISQSPDQRLLATCSGDNTIRIWSLTADRRLGNLATYVEDDGTIYHVVPGTSSAQKLLVGDTLLEMDGKPFSKLAEHFAAGGQWPYAPEQEVTVKFRRRGVVRETTVSLSDIGDVVEPLVNIRVSPDGAEWIAWTQPGYYAASARGDQMIGWQINQGRPKAARFTYANQFSQQFYRPDVVYRTLQTGDLKQGIELANAGYSNPPKPADIRVDFQKLSPPTVKILQPAAGTRFTEPDVTVLAEIRTSNAAPISDVTVIVNGRSYPAVATRGANPQPIDPEDAFIVTQTVRLSPDLNRISVQVRSSASMGRSAEIQVHCTAPPPKPKLFAVGIGVSLYKDARQNLNFAAKDAEDFIAAMQEQKARGAFADVQTRLLTNGQADSKAVVTEIGWLQQATADDLAIVFLAAHGYHDRNQRYFVATHEADAAQPWATCLNWIQLITMLRDLPCRKVLFLDTCHAGGVWSRPEVAFDPYRQFENAGLVIYAAAEAGKLSLELDGNGAFTRGLLDTLKNVAYDTDKDGYLSLAELELGLDERVWLISERRQRPAAYRAGVNERIFRLPIAIASAGSPRLQIGLPSVE